MTKDYRNSQERPGDTQTESGNKQTRATSTPSILRGIAILGAMVAWPLFHWLARRGKPTKKTPFLSILLACSMLAGTTAWLLASWDDFNAFLSEKLTITKTTLEIALSTEERRHPLIHVAKDEQPLQVKGTQHDDNAPPVPTLSCSEQPKLLIPNSLVDFSVGMSQHDMLDVSQSWLGQAPTTRDVAILKQAIKQWFRTCVLWSGIAKVLGDANKKEVRFSRFGNQRHQLIRFMGQSAYVSFSRGGEVSEVFLALYPDNTPSPGPQHVDAFKESLMKLY